MNPFYRVIIMIFLNGATALLAQTVLFREITSQVYINELVLSSMLAVWLLAGAFASGYIHEKYLKKLDDKKLGLVFALAPVANAFLTLASIFIVRCMRPALGMPAEIPVSVWDAILLSMVVFGPVSMLLAIGFSAASEVLKRQKQAGQSGYIYLFEAAGAVAAGFLYTLFLCGRYGNLEVLYAMGVLNLAAIYVLFREKTMEARAIMITVIAALFIYLGFTMAGMRQKADTASSRAMYSKYTVIADRDFPTEKLTLARQGETYLVFENGALSYAIPDPKYRELAGWPVLAHAGNSRVLVINGGIAGIAEELFKYNGVKQVTALESDPYTAAVLEQVFARAAPPGKTVQYASGDAVYFLNKGNKAAVYDTVILNFRQPDTIYGNRLFTKEFFALVKKRLAPDGLLAFTLPLGEDYAGKELINAAGRVCAAAMAVFGEVKALPGDNIMVFASDSHIGLTPFEITKRLAVEKEDSPVFNKKYIEDKLNPDRVKKAEVIFRSNSRPNSLFSPTAYLSYVRTDILRFNSRADVMKIIIIIALFGALAARLFDLKTFRDRPAPYLAMFLTGFAAIVTEVVLLVLFQSYYGYIYKSFGLLVGFFMLGAALGALAGRVERGPNAAAAAGALIAVNLAILALPLIRPGAALISTLIIIAGAAGGAVFSALVKDTEASMLYSSDMAGGAFGALLLNLVIMPFTGLYGAIIINAVMLFAAVYMLRQKPAQALRKGDR
jgi:spermidine synthase